MTDPVKLIRECPIGWDADGKLLTHRSANDADIIGWIDGVDKALRELIDARVALLERTDEISGLTERLRIAESTRDAAQVTSNHDLQQRRFAFDVIRMLLASAYPHPTEHPTMHRAWVTAEEFLNRGY